MRGPRDCQARCTRAAAAPTNTPPQGDERMELAPKKTGLSTARLERIGDHL
jgi:hypothetical protein